MIHHIEFSASLPSKSIRRRLLTSLNACKSVKGAVAYWTIGTDFFQGKLANALALPDSFMCVDLKLPTNIDKLSSFVKKDSNIYLHHYMLETKINHETKDNLLHEKVLLFDYENDAEIWVGSHNMTIRALAGINKEAAFIIRLSKDEKLYQEVKQHLTWLRNICIPFDSKLVEYYKWLQGKFENPELILRMFTPDLNKLRYPKTTIQLLGLDDFGFSKLKTVNKDLYLEVNNCYETTFFIAEILLVGDVDPFNPASYEINFQPMMYAFIRKNILPIIRPENTYDIKSDRIRNFKYFVNIQIIKEIPAMSYMKIPNDLWEYEKIELDTNKEDENLFMAIDIPDFIKIKKASVEKMSTQVLCFNEKPKETFNQDSIKKLLDYYDEVVSKGIIEKKELANTLNISIPIPKELKMKSNEIIFKGLISK